MERIDSRHDCEIRTKPDRVMKPTTVHTWAEIEAFIAKLYDEMEHEPYLWFDDTASKAFFFFLFERNAATGQIDKIFFLDGHFLLPEHHRSVTEVLSRFGIEQTDITVYKTSSSVEIKNPVLTVTNFSRTVDWDQDRATECVKALLHEGFSREEPFTVGVEGSIEL